MHAMFRNLLAAFALVAPVVASILYPAAGPVAAVLVVALLRMDRLQPADEAAAGLD